MRSQEEAVNTKEKKTIHPDEPIEEAAHEKPSYETPMMRY